jgi:hypothetical protein
MIVAAPMVGNCLSVILLPPKSHRPYAWRAVMSLPVDITASDARPADIYARRFDLGLRAPDALHLAIARRLDATLVTLDRRLATAARELGVPVEDPRQPAGSERRAGGAEA